MGAAVVDESSGREPLRPQSEGSDRCRRILDGIITIVNGDPRISRSAARFTWIVSLAIVVSIATTCFGTVPSLHEHHATLLVMGIINLVTGAIFVAEFLLRFIAATKLKALCALVRDPLTWVDVFALVPFFFDLFDDDLDSNAPDFVQAMRLMRLLRLFTLARHFEGAIVLWAALSRALPMLAVPLYFLVTAVLSFAGLLYVVEFLTYGNEDFNNVFTCAWFVLVTMTSVGYGDIVPASVLGKVVASAAIMAGTLCLAMPITIVGSAFIDVWETRAKAVLDEAALQLAAATQPVSHINALSMRARRITSPPPGKLDAAASRPSLERVSDPVDGGVGGPSAGSHHRLPRLRTVTIAGDTGASDGASTQRDSNRLSEVSRRTTVDPGVAARLSALELAVQDVKARSGQTAAALERIEGVLKELVGGAKATGAV